jgi:hypothetical protein
MRSLNDFRERINHEFDDIAITLTIFGLKIDGDGLKKHCKLNALKSVDYIYPKNNKFPLVEFSDLARQKNQILQHITEIKSSQGLSSSLKRELILKKHKEVHTELVQKYKDTLTIISNLTKYISDVPENLQNKNKYYIVVAPFHAEIEDSRKPEIARFLDALKDKITLAIPDEIFVGVEVIRIEDFAKPDIKLTEC